MAVANNINIQEDIVRILVDGLKGNDAADEYSPSISLVPSTYRDLSPASFNPRVVCIGPIHHEDENLKRSEGRKRSYMHDLLLRLGSPIDETLDTCLSKINALIHEIRACYAGMRPYSDPELAIMMVTDSCFILEFLYKIFEFKVNAFLKRDIIVDLLLVENQIPFFVLKSIFECTLLKSEPILSLTNHIFPVMEYGNICLFLEDLTMNNVYETDCPHILGLLHKYYQPTYNIRSGFDLSLIHNAVELDKAGVSFKPNQDDKESWPMAMKLELSRFPWLSWFWGKPILKMRVFCISDYTELLLRNLIAYEQKYEASHYITSYATLMDILVDNQEDITLMVESKVIVNKLGSNEEAANMLNNITKEVPFEHFFYFEQWIHLHSYYIGYWPRNISWLRRKYFNNPWTIIALLATIILFTLTAVQTYFTIVQTSFAINPK